MEQEVLKFLEEIDLKEFTLKNPVNLSSYVELEFSYSYIDMNTTKIYNIDHIIFNPDKIDDPSFTKYYIFFNIDNISNKAKVYTYVSLDEIKNNYNFIYFHELYIQLTNKYRRKEINF